MYTVIRPANHYPSRLAEFGPDAPVVKLVTPRLSPSRIGEYLVMLPAGGGTPQPVPASGLETLLYGLRGAAAVAAAGADLALGAGAYAYLPPGAAWTVRAGAQPATFLAIRRAYESWGDLPAPAMRSGHRDDEPFARTAVPGFRRRELLPVDDPAFDCAMSLLAFDPGVGLDKIEVHDEEHGLYMTAGQGIYTLGAERHEVRADDFVYMAPYCPQGFDATGDGVAEYLLYKDAWRDGF
ncbi:MAG: (S)-ureidoglycine aminohydrolase [Solirubrobacteraceae bacterium]|jgi:(S)-ureidoglycine aminohydrolase|nr:(S)-ureidoglycine aminohydrolase [Solirubrobacteraceae bacterium]